MKTFGQIAFEAWCSSPGSLVGAYAIEQAWDRCSEHTKATWERVAEAVRWAAVNRQQGIE